MKNTATPFPAALRAQRRSLLWRIHFWAALIASPVALLAALSGVGEGDAQGDADEGDEAH